MDSAIIGCGAVRFPAFAITQDAETAIDHDAAFEALLIAHPGQPRKNVVVVGALLGCDGGDAFVG